MNFSLKIRTLHRFWKFRLRAEKESIAYVLSRSLENKTVLDIGANKGVYTYWLSKKVGANGKVYAFEPQPELGEFLEESKKTFKLDNVEIVNKGLSSESSQMVLYRRKIGDGAAMIASEQNKLFDPSGKEKLDIEVIKLDDFIVNEKIEDVAFIKCDVEGHELEVFKGAVASLKRFKPTILFECHHEEAKEGEVFNLLKDIGYHGFFFHGKEKLSVDDFETIPYPRSDNHRNYIFVPNTEKY